MMKGTKAALSRCYVFAAQQNIEVVHQKGEYRLIVADKQLIIEQGHHPQIEFHLRQKDQILLEVILPKLIYRKGKILPETPIVIHYGTHTGSLIKEKKGYLLSMDGHRKGQLKPYRFFHHDEIWFDSSIVNEVATALCVILKIVQANFELPLV